MNCFFIFYIFTFLFGLVVGSFLNCVIYRLWTGESFFRGRSHCPYCKHKLSWQDLIPILSFLILKGRCRYCGRKISLQYPLVEFFTGVLFVLVLYYSFPNLLLTIYYLLVSAFLIIIFVYDLKHYIIPDKIIYPAVLVSGIWYLVSGIFLNTYAKYEILNIIYSTLSAAGFFLLIFLFSRGKWLGFGDVKLAFFLGLFLGFPKILVALFFSFFIGAIIGVGLILTGKKTLKSQVPFGPFLVTGTFVALFFGNQIVNWYLGFVSAY